MLPDRVSNPGPLTYESDALPIALRGPRSLIWTGFVFQRSKQEVTNVYPLCKNRGEPLRCTHTPSVQNSLDAESAFKRCTPGRVAQSVGRLTQEPEVPGSIPGPATYFRFSFR